MKHRSISLLVIQSVCGRFLVCNFKSKTTFNLFYTYKLDAKNYRKYMNSRQRPQDAKDCFSVKFEPVISRDDEQKTIEIFAFPALHLYLGVVNKLCEVLDRVCIHFHLWPERLHVVR